jgi:hypothetical protein
VVAEIIERRADNGTARPIDPALSTASFAVSLGQNSLPPTE